MSLVSNSSKHFPPPFFPSLPVPLWTPYSYSCGCQVYKDIQTLHAQGGSGGGLTALVRYLDFETAKKSMKNWLPWHQLNTVLACSSGCFCFTLGGKSNYRQKQETALRISVCHSIKKQHRFWYNCFTLITLPVYCNLAQQSYNLTLCVLWRDLCLNNLILTQLYNRIQGYHHHCVYQEIQSIPTTSFISCISKTWSEQRCARPLSF